MTPRKTYLDGLNKAAEILDGKKDCLTALELIRREALREELKRRKKS